MEKKSPQVVPTTTTTTTTRRSDDKQAMIVRLAEIGYADIITKKAIKTLISGKKSNAAAWAIVKSGYTDAIYYDMVSEAWITIIELIDADKLIVGAEHTSYTYDMPIIQQIEIPYTYNTLDYGTTTITVYKRAIVSRTVASYPITYATEERTRVKSYHSAEKSWEKGDSYTYCYASAVYRAVQRVMRDNAAYRATEFQIDYYNADYDEVKSIDYDSDALMYDDCNGLRLYREQLRSECIASADSVCGYSSRVQRKLAELLLKEKKTDVEKADLLRKIITARIDRLLTWEQIAAEIGHEKKYAYRIFKDFADRAREVLKPMVAADYDSGYITTYSEPVLPAINRTWTFKHPIVLSDGTKITSCKVPVTRIGSVIYKTAKQTFPYGKLEKYLPTAKHADKIKVLHMDFIENKTLFDYFSATQSVQTTMRCNDDFIKLTKSEIQELCVYKDKIKLEEALAREKAIRAAVGDYQPIKDYRSYPPVPVKPAPADINASQKQRYLISKTPYHAESRTYNWLNAIHAADRY